MSDPFREIRARIPDIALIDQLTDEERLIEFCKRAKNGGLQTLQPLLPLLLSLDGHPYTLKDHFHFEPLFRVRRAKRTVWCTGRQVAKTTSEAACALMRANCIPFYKTLFITPLFEQVRRISSNHIAKFIRQSPLKHLLQGTKTENSVLQKSFLNQAQMYFSFALLDADRVRGYSTDEINYDEVQDMDKSFFAVIEETKSHSKWGGFVQYAGTPKTPENTLSGLFGESSMAEWIVPCPSCHKDNICSTKYDLDKMIGPHWQPAEGYPFIGTVCARCGRIVDPADGYWEHRYPSKRWTMPGYHIPQPITHFHYSSPDKWSELLAKRDGVGNYTPAKYFNEVLGEPAGTGTQLVSAEELQAASTVPWPNDPRDMSFAASQAPKYDFTILAADWGGGGEDQISLTTLAVLGYLSTGQIHVIWGRRLMTPHDHLGEAGVCLEVFRKFRCKFVVHDYTGAGALRETFLRHHRIPLSRIIPIAYVRAATRKCMQFKAATDIHPRDHYNVDKTRSLQLVCAEIKLKRLKFFQYDHVSSENPGLIHDFLGLVENKAPTSRGIDIYTIQRHATLPDDFAQAVNIGCCSIWHLTEKWPSLSEVGIDPLHPDAMGSVEPASDADWGDEDLA